MNKKDFVHFIFNTCASFLFRGKVFTKIKVALSRVSRHVSCTHNDFQGVLWGTPCYDMLHYIFKRGSFGIYTCFSGRGGITYRHNTIYVHVRAQICGVIETRSCVLRKDDIVILCQDKIVSYDEFVKPYLECYLK